MSCCDQLCMLIWKQWLTEKRNVFKVFSEVSLPLIVAAILLITNTFYTTTFHQDAVFKRYKTGIGSTNFSNQTELIYCPTNKLLMNLVWKTATMIGISNVKSFRNKYNMAEYVKAEVVQERLFAAIQFHDINQQPPSSLPMRLKVSLRFPEFHIAQGFNTSWMTNFIFPPVLGIRYGLRDEDDPLGPFPHYQRRGFLVLQEALSLAFIDSHKQLDNIPNIFMQRHPRPSWRRREVYSSESATLNAMLFMFLSLILVFVGVIKLVTYDKEVQVKQALETAGVPNWIQWTSYFIRSLALFAICFGVLLFGLKIPTGQSLLSFSNNLLVILFFFCFSIASITLAFLISVTNNSTITAATFGAILWFISFLPYYQLKRDIFGVAMGCIFAPLAFFHGFDIIFAFEITREGLQWHNLWKYPTPKHRLCFAHILLSLSGCAIFYLLLTFYIEDFRSGATRRKFIELFKKCVDSNQDNTSVWYNEDVIQEPPPSNLPVTVKVVNVQKIYSKQFTVLDNLSFELYENQITILLGPNGAGKTTAANIIAGIAKPTKGTVKIYKSNLRKILGEHQTYLGYCPQTNILFDRLTVEEHIYFFSRIKGFSNINAIEEADKYISMLHLSDKATTAACYLTEGLKRILSIALALCANSKIVILDEVTASVDPVSKRIIWNMLDAEKSGRSILITTHSMDEAEILGDRILIIADGVLKCSGSSMYLKEKFAEGYRLVITKGTDFSTTKMHDFLQKYIPNIKIASDVGTQLCFVLKKAYSSVIEKLLNDLEENQDYLAIQNFRISMPTLEDVFIKTTVGVHTIPFDQVEERQITCLKGRRLYFNRIVALLLKKFLQFKTSWIILLVHTIFVLLLVVVSGLSIYDKQAFDMPPLEIALKTYPDSVLVVYGDNIYKKEYIKMAKASKAKIIDTRDITTTIFEHMKKDRMYIMHYCHGGVSFLENNTLIAWYNGFPFHSAPLTLNLVLNAVLKHHISEQYNIEVINHPLRLTELQKALRTDASNYEVIQYLMAVFSSVFIIFVIREANIKAMRQQFMCGITPRIYWTVTFYIDITIYTLLAVAVISIMASMTDSYNRSVPSLCYLFLILISYGFASLSLCYLLQRFFTTTSTGYLAKIFVGIFGIMIATLLQYMVKTVSVSEWIFYVFIFIPTFCLSSALDGLNRFQDIEKACTMLFDSCIKYANRENCSNLIAEFVTERHICDVSFFSMKYDGIFIYLLSLWCIGLFFLVINIMIDSSLFARSINKFYKKKFRLIRDEDEDVVKEREWIRGATPKELGARTIVLKDVCKTYKKTIALNRVSVAINPYECFGFIGSHGAGKSTIFNIVSGCTYGFSGEILIAGMNLEKNMEKVRSMIVYCPETDGLFRYLTGEQNLMLYALIRGIPYRQTKEVAKIIAQKLDFWRHLHQEVNHYSGGNKRKLCAAIALLGNAKLVFLDEPAIGMDVSTSKHLWAAIYSERQKGKTVVLATHCMEECEAVCDRVAVLVKGKIACIGSIETLANKFVKGYILTIRFKKVRQKDPKERKQILMNFMKEKLPTAVLLESFKEVYTFKIEMEPSLSWTKVFSTIDKNKAYLNIEDYTLTKSSLEQIYLSMS